jgi:hypothetical protein
MAGSGERGEVVVVALAATLDQVLARQRGGGVIPEGEKMGKGLFAAWDGDDRMGLKQK